MVYTFEYEKPKNIYKGYYDYYEPITGYSYVYTYISLHKETLIITFDASGTQDSIKLGCHTMIGACSMIIWSDDPQFSLLAIDFKIGQLDSRLNELLCQKKLI